MARGKPLTHIQIDKALTLVAAGFTLSKIADEIGCHPTALNRVLLEDYSEDYEGAKERRRDLIRSERWRRAFRGDDDRHSAKFLDDLALEQLPETREARKQVSGATAQEERADQLASALERLNALFAARGIPASLTQGPAGVATDPQ